MKYNDGTPQIRGISEMAHSKELVIIENAEQYLNKYKSIIINSKDSYRSRRANKMDNPINQKRISPYIFPQPSLVILFRKHFR